MNRRHDPVVKGKGADAYAICDGCVRQTFRCVELVRGSRQHVNRAVRQHREAQRIARPYWGWAARG